ncbi:FAD/NAD(P)-binding protein [Aggregatimonas sangjinii]|uniref:FAD/NAD(P)-binding protein n=1 Tax=Aggregatimonas sangjinii TaxID=2583587 RepID=A0A5B7SVI1_9FLAO|nr:FAD/NAD(P)-binding protein [Aggregatimonas sangjinii]QCX02192.1 FAD/NAD(P)-binding protein [Aggregatimonas sangjinii]
MKDKIEMATVAIIGCGPRGLSALEALYAQAAPSEMVKVLIFEPATNPGAGVIYNLDQADSNWLNVSTRDLGIPARDKVTFETFALPEYPDFQDWIGYSEEKEESTAVDQFPLRSKLGEYLSSRYKSIANILAAEGLLTFIPEEVRHLDVEGDLLKIDTYLGQSYTADEVVLTIGHQPIDLNAQLKGWLNYIDGKDHLEVFVEPYPVERLIQSDKINTESIVGIRGFGLAMIDVVRALTEGRGGHFNILDQTTGAMAYIPSGREPKQLVPFSLDGLPMTPKPLHENIDTYYTLTEKESTAYESFLENAIYKSTPPQSIAFLIDAITPLIVRKYGVVTSHHSKDEEEIRKAIKNWLSDEDFEHDFILSKRNTTRHMTERFVQMATGQGDVSLDYCVGQVWRHCQPIMYRQLSFAPLSDELIAKIVALDERLKRYSYGPPVASMQQLLALLKSGHLTFDFVKNPKIKEAERGWKLCEGTQSVIADIMINSVLDAPQVLEVTTALPKALINDSLAQPLHDDLGIRTRTDGRVETDGPETQAPIAVLGRLAKGTLIGVDAIAECFGSRSRYWATGVFERLNSKQYFR